ncbi:MAG: hypothetical protein PHT69_01035 [Bacteroidales bacterium]|nr:hypothetical protein [Bacteroidales bacterium]
MNKAVIIILVLVNHYLLLGQNLVVNSDFRKTTDTISDLIDNNEGLRGFGTVDFYHPSAERFFPWIVPPNTAMGYANPKCGDGFGGFIYYTYIDVLGNVRPCFEHIQFALVEKLERNKHYRVSFFIKLANNKYAGKNLGILFSKESNFVRCPDIRYRRFVDYVNCFDHTTKAHIEISDPQILIDTSWTKVTAIYKAEGGEQYMTIGVFWQENPKIIKAYERLKNSPLNSRLRRRFSKVLKREILVENPYKTPPTTQWDSYKERGAYYFIDCVSVEKIEE